MKPTKVEFYERYGHVPTDAIIVQCRNLIWNKIREKHTGYYGYGLKSYVNTYTHSKKACLVCKYRFRCYTIK